MSRWRLTAHESSGRAMITLNDNGRPVGVFNISIADYENLCRTAMSGLNKIVQKELFARLHEELWHRAQRASHENAEEAQKKLLELGWKLEDIEAFVNNMVIQIAGELLTKLQEHVT